MKEAEIWQQEHHEVIWQTAVQTKIWRGRLKGGEEKVLKHNSKFTGGKKKKAEIISCLRSSAWFILRLRNCAVDFTMFTALKQKRNAWQGYIWKHPAPWVLLESVGNRVLSLAHAPAEVVCHLFSGGAIPVATGAGLYRWLSLTFGSLSFWHSTKMHSCNALKSFYLQAWVCNVYYSWQGFSFETEVMTDYLNKMSRSECLNYIFSR